MSDGMDPSWADMHGRRGSEDEVAEADPGRRWRVRVDFHPGPWVSLGLHIDIGTPLIDLHIGWWLVSLGRLYAKPVRLRPWVPRELTDSEIGDES